MISEERMTLKQLREINKKTVAEIAKALGVTETAIYNYESGRRQINLNQILILSELYQITVEDFVGAQLYSSDKPNK